MAFRGPALLALFLLMAVPAHGHKMGRPVPIGYSGGDLPQAHLAAQVVASYFAEQMGRETVLVEMGDVEELFEQIVTRKTPMAVVPFVPADEVPEGVVYVFRGFDTGVGIFDLVMGREAREDLQFSLVPRYMELLSSRLTYDAWEKGIIRVSGGEGVRKVALEMLREADLL